MASPDLTSKNEVFEQTLVQNIVSSRYDLTEKHVGNFKLGRLYPVYCRTDICPGDEIKLSTQPFLRFAPLVAPAFTDVDVEFRYFLVPYRLIYTKWKQFFSPQTAQDAAIVPPYFYFGEVSAPTDGKKAHFDGVFYNYNGSLYDYLGYPSRNYGVTLTRPIPPSSGGNGNWSAHVINGDMSNSSGIFYDWNGYQNESAPYDSMNAARVPYNPFAIYAYNMVWNEYFRDENLQSKACTNEVEDTQSANHKPPTASSEPLYVNWRKDYFSSSLPFVTQSILGQMPTIDDGISIPELRERSAIFKWAENQTIGGNRYQESIYTHFGVRVPDEAAQIPVYLGGGSFPMRIASIEQNSETGTTPLGTLAGKGTADGSAFIDGVKAAEHCVLLGVMYARPKAIYNNAVSKGLLAINSRNDLYFPEFANLGDDAVLQQEYFGSVLMPHYATLDAAYGYQMRYASMRTALDHVHGELKIDGSLKEWTQARGFTDEGVVVSPTVNSGFIACHPSTRIFADENTDAFQLVGEVTTIVDMVRPLPNYVNPKID